MKTLLISILIFSSSFVFGTDLCGTRKLGETTSASADTFEALDLLNTIVATVSAQEALGRELTESESLAVEQAVITVEQLYTKGSPTKYEIIRTQYRVLQQAGFSPSEIRKIISEI